MSPQYDVFICHRGEDTKRNSVSVLNGMLRSRGITCFVDYQMNEGSEIEDGIMEAIKSSRVHIVLLSPSFQTAKWCVDEVFEIMDLQNSTCISNKPRKVIPIFCDVDRLDILKQAKGLKYIDIKRSSSEDRQRWSKAIESLCHLKLWFEYNSMTMSQWEALSNVVKEAEIFLTGDSSRSFLPHQGEEYQNRTPAQDYDVFICHGLDVKLNLVSVLSGILRCKNITYFVHDGNDDEAAIKPQIEEAIEKSKVYVILLSPKFANSKRSLEEVFKIMSVKSSLASTNVTRRVLPVFYEVRPSSVRHQLASFNLDEVTGITDDERKRWSESLKRLSLIKGFEFQREITFHWEALEEVVKKVRMSLNESTRRNLYVEEMNEVQKVLESRKSQDVLLIGICGPNESQFIELLEEEISSEFDELCRLSDVMKNASEDDRLSHTIRKLYSALIPIRDEILPSYDELIRGRRYQELLQKKKCLVILDVFGNDIHQTAKLLELLKIKLRNRSTVLLTSEFKHMLTEVVKVDKLIELPSLQDNKGTLIICYRERDNVHESFLNHLQETFSMCGLEVHLFTEEEVLRNVESTRNAKMILCIATESFSVGDFEIKLNDGAIVCPEILYIFYGPHGINETNSKCSSSIEVNFEKSEFNRTEFKFMVNKVLHIFGKRDEKIMPVIDFPVGLVECVDEMKSCIFTHIRRSETSLKCFGIVGMGGVGKTTIAKSIYNGMYMYTEFEKTCFCLNTRAEVAATKSGMVDMQKNILFHMLGKRYNEEEIRNEEDGKRVLQAKLKGINALVVLDDVDTKQQLEALYDPLCWSLGQQSVVIITTRYHEVLKFAQPKEIFHIEGLGNRQHSERLFYWHALLKPEPPAHLKAVSKKLIDACQGLPLSLQVTGAHLYGHNDKNYWDESLRSLQENGMGIFSVLSLSLKGLESNQREAFFDICCFFIGEKEETACTVLKGCYGYGRTYLNVLKSRCLITIYDGNVIGMHDHLRDMGREIIRREKRHRVWDDQSVDQDILKDAMALSKLRGISLRSNFLFPKEVRKSTFLPAWKILKVKQGYGHTSTTIWEKLFANELLENVRCDELRWLDWKEASFARLPRGLCSANLRVLDLSNSAVRSVPIASLPNLQILNLPECIRLTYLPKEMARHTSLQQLDLNNCTSLTTLSALPTTLEKLDLDGCKRLESLEVILPNISQLDAGGCFKLKRLNLDATSMRSLVLSDCTELQALDCKGLPSLEQLELRCCTSVRTFSSLPTVLQKMHLDDCETLVSLEAFLPKLQQLHIRKGCNLKKLDLDAFSMRYLNLSYCIELEELNWKGFPSLEELDLDYCKSLRTFSSLPETLHKLDLSHCENLESLEAFLPNLQQLHVRDTYNLRRFRLDARSIRSLNLSYCEELEELDCKGLPSLEELFLENCRSLRTLSSLPTTLQKLPLSCCESLESVEAFLPNLLQLETFCCRALKRLDLNAPSMLSLDLTNCEALQELDCQGLPSLEQLFLESCKALATLISLPTTLQKLRLSYCESLESLEAFLPNLPELDAGNCYKLKILDLNAPSMQLLNQSYCKELELDCKGLSSFPITLQKLRLSYCESLESLEAFLPSLLQLECKGCFVLKTLDLNAPSMHSLDLRNCEELQELDCGGLPCLEELLLDNCRSLRTLSSLPPTVQKLLLSFCENLASFEAFLPNLKEIKAWDCTKLKRLGAPSMRFSSMRSLSLPYCGELEELDCEGLPSLEQLFLDSCRSLRALSSLPTSLQELRLSYCESLESLEAFLPKLPELDARNCYKLKRLDLNAPSMRLLNLSYGKELEELDCKGFPPLERLNLYKCSALRTLSSFPTILSSLPITFPTTLPTARSSLPTILESLESLEAFLPSVQVLDLRNCYKLKRLVLDAPSMLSLNCSGCENLKELDCKGLPFLEQLFLDDCRSVRTVTSLPTNLQELYFLGCDSLDHLEVFLPNLQKLDAWYCGKLKRLDLNAPSMRSLVLSDCKELEELNCKGLPSLQSLSLYNCTSLKILSLNECKNLEVVDGIETLSPI